MATHKETSFATESTVKTDSSLTAEQALDNEHGVKVDDKAVAADSVVAADSAVNDENRVAGDAEVVAADAAATTEAGVTGGEPTTAADATVATAAIKPVPTTDELLENGAPAHIAGPINMDAQIFMTNTKSSGFAILVLADNITTTPSEKEIDRLNDVLTRIFPVAEDYWSGFMPVTAATCAIMNVHTHNRPAVAAGTAYVPILAAFWNNKNPETKAEDVTKWELMLVKYIVALTKVYKGRGLAAAHADGALDDYLPALDAMVAGQPHPDIKTVKHILADYFKEPLIDVRRAIIKESHHPAIRHWALDFIPMRVEPPAHAAQSSSSAAAAAASDGQADGQESSGNGQAEVGIKDNAAEAAKARGEETTKDKAEATTNDNAAEATKAHAEETTKDKTDVTTKAHAEAATKEAEATTEVNADAEVVLEGGQGKEVKKWKGKGKAKDEGEQATEWQAEPAAGQAEHSAEQAE